MKKEKLKIQWGVLIPSVLLGVQICAAIFLLDYFYKDISHYFAQYLEFKEGEMLQRIVDKMAQKNQYARPDIIGQAECTSWWHYKTVREILDYFDKTVCDVELILDGEFHNYISGIRFEDSNSVVYYFYFEDSFNYWASGQCLTFKQFVYQILNNKIRAFEAVLPDGSSEVCGSCFYYNFDCNRFSHSEFKFFQPYYSDFVPLAYKPFAYYKIKSDFTGKEYLLDISVLSDKEKKELGLAGKNLFITKLLYFLFVDNPNEYLDEDDFIIVSTAGEPDFCHSEELFSDFFCTSSKAESCPSF